MSTDLVRRALTGQRFDKVFAVNVNLFWVRPADAELQLIKDLLCPGGVLQLVLATSPYDDPAAELHEDGSARLRDHPALLG